VDGPFIHSLKASAGAGKTQSLTGRFLSLLSECPPSEEFLRQIVAITFTRRAAAEMRERIIRHLKEIALGMRGGMERELAEGWLDVVLHHYGDFHVRTIDSLMYALFRALSLEMGIGPDVEVTFRTEELLDLCFDRVLASADEEGEVGRLLEDLLHTYLQIEEAKGFRIEVKVKRRLYELFPHLEGRTRREKAELSERKRKLEEVARKLREAFKERSVPFPEEVLDDPVGNLSRAFWKGKVKVDSDLLPLYQQAMEARRAYLWELARARISPYLDLLSKMKEEMDRIVKEEGVLLGGSWIEGLREYLRGLQRPGPYAFVKFGTSLRYFLMDEFQDTSTTQWEALLPLVEEALSQGGGLFYVGDVKQAIYGWRGGDWRLFDRVMQGSFPSVSPEGRRTEILSTNYRSLEGIVRFNNRLWGLMKGDGFPKKLARMILGGRGEEIKGGELIEELASIIRRNFQDVCQQLPPGEERKGGEIRTEYFRAPKEELLPQVKEKVLEEITGLWKERRGGIAVLVRTNEQAEEVAGWIQSEGIPVVTENSLRLRRSRVVKGVVALLRFLDYPPDDLAFWGALSSGILDGLPELPPEELKAFLAEGNWTPPLYKAFSARFPEAFEGYLKPLLGRVGFLAPYEMVREIIERLRLLERYPEERALLRRLLELAFRGERGGEGSLPGFLSFWEREGAEERLGLPERVEAVRVLTIHKAKGLEFPVVFIPFTNWLIQTPRIINDRSKGLLSLKNPLPEDLEEMRLRKKMEEAIEALNLLYVATTRPREALYLYVTCYPSGRGVRTEFVAAWLREMLKEIGDLKDGQDT